MISQPYVNRRLLLLQMRKDGDQRRHPVHRGMMLIHRCFLHEVLVRHHLQVLHLLLLPMKLLLYRGGKALPSSYRFSYRNSSELHLMEELD